MSETSLEEALEGLRLAAQYCESRDMASHAEEMETLFQDIVQESPDTKAETTPVETTFDDLFEDI